MKKILLNLALSLGVFSSAQIALPYTENFGSIVANNDLPIVTGGTWTRTGTSSDQPTYIDNQIDYNRSGNGDTKFICYYWLGNTGGNSYIVGPFALTAGVNYTSSILYKADGYTGFGPLELKWGTDATAATHTNTIASVAADITNLNFQKLSGTFSVATSGSYYLSIKETNTTSPWYLTLDDFKLNETPTCLEPSLLTSTNFTSTSATLNWNAPNPSPGSGYEVYYSTTNSTPTSSTVLNATNSVTSTTATANLSGLTANTNYYCWVRSVCSSTIKSEWSIQHSFSTPCNPLTTLPWTENFDSMTSIGSGIVPGCWQNVKGTNNWISANSSNTSLNAPKSIPNYMQLEFGNTIASQLWTPGFQLTAGVSYDFSFFYNNNGTTSSFQGFTANTIVNTSKTLTGATDLGTFLTSSQAVGSYTQKINTFVPATSGVYYFAINASSTSNPWYLGIDDFKLEITPTCAAPLQLSVSAITNTSATATWQAPATAPANGYEYKYTTTNTPPTVAGTPTTALTFNMTALTQNTTYYVWVRSMCNGVASSWSSKSFTTLYTPPANDICTGAYGATTFPFYPYSYVQNDGIGGTSPQVLTTCANGQNDGLWFKFPGTGGPTTINVSNVSAGFDPQLAIFGGTCTALTCIGTVDNGFSGGNETYTFNSVLGTSYYANVGQYSSSPSTQGNFTISITTSLSTSETEAIAKTIKIYPNPAQDEINIASETAVKEVMIIDMNGRLISNNKLNAGKLNLTQLSKGNYILKIKLEDGNEISKKLIKK